MSAPEQPDALPQFTDDDARSILELPPTYTTLHTHAPLPLPVCLPQLTTGYDCPFARGSSPALLTSGVQQEDWLHFVDAMNIAMAGSPPLRVVGLVGTVIGFVPHHWFQLAGTLITTSAQVGQRFATKSLTDRALRVANTEFFGPRGLSVRICTTSAMKALVLRGEEVKKKSKAKQFALGVGRAAMGLALRVPTTAHVIDVLSSAPNLDYSVNSVTERRLAALAPHVLPLSLDVLPQHTPRALMDKASALSLKLQLWQAKRAERSATDARQLLAIAEGRAAPSPNVTSKNPLEFLANRQRTMKQLRAAHAGNNARSMHLLRTEARRQDRLEEHKTKSILWLVLINSDLAESIEDLASAGPGVDQELIEEQDWDAEIDRELHEAVQESAPDDEIAGEGSNDK